jgi:hypothetical protein
MRLVVDFPSIVVFILKSIHTELTGRAEKRYQAYQEVSLCEWCYHHTAEMQRTGEINQLPHNQTQSNPTLCYL